MHYQFLIEDQSGAILIETLMHRIREQNPDITFDCKNFKGIGGLTPKNTVKETKTGKLLNDLATYLRGFSKSLQYIPAVIVIVLDNDTRDTGLFLEELQEVARQNAIRTDHVFCIAVEEMEAWLLGDEVAVLTAYPGARVSVLRSYVPDSICGTWEVLADAVYPGGLVRFRRDCQTYCEKGTHKCAWAYKIGLQMSLAEGDNRSPSFRAFLHEIQSRLPTVS